MTERRPGSGPMEDPGILYTESYDEVFALAQVREARRRYKHTSEGRTYEWLSEQSMRHLRESLPGVDDVTIGRVLMACSSLSSYLLMAPPLRGHPHHALNAMAVAAYRLIRPDEEGT